MHSNCEDENFKISLIRKVNYNNDYNSNTQDCEISTSLTEVMKILLRCFTDFLDTSTSNPRQYLISECQDSIFRWMGTSSAFKLLNTFVSPSERDFMQHTTSAVNMNIPGHQTDFRLHQIRSRAYEMSFGRKFHQLVPNVQIRLVSGMRSGSVTIIWSLEADGGTSGASQQKMDFELLLEIKTECHGLGNLALISVVQNLENNDQLLSDSMMATETKNYLKYLRSVLLKLSSLTR